MLVSDEKIEAKGDMIKKSKVLLGFHNVVIEQFFDKREEPRS